MIISEQKALFPLHEMIVEEKDEACFGRRPFFSRSQALSPMRSTGSKQRRPTHLCVDSPVAEFDNSFVYVLFRIFAL